MAPPPGSASPATTDGAIAVGNLEAQIASAVGVLGLFWLIQRLGRG